MIGLPFAKTILDIFVGWLFCEQGTRVIDESGTMTGWSVHHRSIVRKHGASHEVNPRQPIGVQIRLQRQGPVKVRN
ncbi:MAG: hypothetical protein ACI814_004189 [Mariniblastus sp.]|jgi:hypothetical protein